MVKCSRIKRKTGRLAVEEYNVRESWKKYFEDCIIFFAEDLSTIKMHGFTGTRMGN